MICPECGGKWIKTDIDGHPRQACEKCGFVDSRMVWIESDYYGPPDLMQSPEFKKHIEDQNNFSKLRRGIMPCCNNAVALIAGPRGGLCINVTCVHCGAKWNLSPFSIERL